MDGFEATATIRRQDRAGGGHVPIVAMTAHAMTGDRERCLAAGMDAYLSKPLRPADLLATIDEVLGGGSAAMSAALVERKGDAASVDMDADTERVAPEINESALLADFGQNRTLLTETIGVFLSEVPSRIAALRLAVVSRGADSVAAAAHSLKGSVGLFSRGRAYESAQSLERAARGGDLTAIETLYTDIEHEVSGVCADLEAFRAKLRMNVV